MSLPVVSFATVIWVATQRFFPSAGEALRDDANRELKKTTTATATATPLNRRFNEENDGSACAL